MSNYHLYNYRRCPYAIRTRMTLRYAGINCTLEDIHFRAKPARMLELSPKGTVPVLVIDDTTVIDESLDIIHWALEQHDPNNWLERHDANQVALLAQNDHAFKSHLDKYKYHSRHPEQDKTDYRAQAETFLIELDSLLSSQPFLAGKTQGLSDVAIFPFIRQFSKVDEAWFYHTNYNALKNWLTWHCDSPLFTQVMVKGLTTTLA